jgi:hypothetical protein
MIRGGSRKVVWGAVVAALALGLLMIGVLGYVGSSDTASVDDGAAPVEQEVPGGDSSSTATGEPPATRPGNPVIRPIPDKQWQRMVNTGTWRPGCPVGRAQLRRLEIDHVRFDGSLGRGVIVAHRDSVDDLALALGELLRQGFPIERMIPVERFGGDVNASLAANNTSAFNCRRPGQINAPVDKSPHANGRAIDINPVQNPWRDPRCRCWNPVGDRSTRTKQGPGVIRAGSLPVEVFQGLGWIWQNIDVADYMHFDTGYPSRPRTPAGTGME